jgi:hypothetical protein
VLYDTNLNDFAVIGDLSVTAWDRLKARQGIDIGFSTVIKSTCQFEWYVFERVGRSSTRTVSLLIDCRFLFQC